MLTTLKKSAYSKLIDLFYKAFMATGFYPTAPIFVGSQPMAMGQATVIPNKIYNGVEECWGKSKPEPTEEIPGIDPNYKPEKPPELDLSNIPGIEYPEPKKAEPEKEASLPSGSLLYGRQLNQATNSAMQGALSQGTSGTSISLCNNYLGSNSIAIHTHLGTQYIALPNGFVLDIQTYDYANNRTLCRFKNPQTNQLINVAL